MVARLPLETVDGPIMEIMRLRRLGLAAGAVLFGNVVFVGSSLYDI